MSIGLALFLGSAVELGAWEEDVHYVLTFWLATQAGFSRNDADQIAKADQGLDDSEHTGAIPTVLWIILTQDLGAARDLQLKHFPNDANLPSPPLRRVVTPNGLSARKPVESALNPGDSATGLIALGEAFHPFQDSWSHQGVPDIPYNLRANLISAHPAQRGGWKSHNADLTYLHVDDTVDTARETYRFLVQFLQQNARYGRHPAAPWAAIEPAVREFAKAETPSAKAQWATQHVPEAQPERIGHAVIAGSTMRIRALSPPLFASRSGQTRLDSADQAALLRTASEFFRQWITQGDVDSALRHVNLQELAGQFEADKSLSTIGTVEEWCKKFLTIQLIDDHKAVNEAGHGDPSHPRYRELPIRPSANGVFKATRRGDPPSITGRDLIPTDLVEQPAVAMVLSNESAVRDALTLVWRKVGGQWWIVRLFAIPD
jgi:hypothetical protein